MVLFWYKLVASGLKKIDDVPAKYRNQVIILIRKNN